MRILCLDYGEKRIGTAVSDPLGISAQGLGFIEAVPESRALGKIKEIAGEVNAEKIVVGLPLNMNGSTGPRAMKVLEFVENLKKIFPDVDIFDERLTTRQAESAMLEADLSRRKRKKIIDKLSAVLILQGYLDSRRMGKNV
ncbi:MAG: Holliday junction resolvase RuvX [Firmicutes bacterium]|nr:Holliday junction resolvase RuvX [Bacillota bacterium]